MANITAKMAKEMSELVGLLSVAKIAAKFGVNPSTVYYHTNKRHADKRRDTYRRSQEKRKAECRRRAFETWAAANPFLLARHYSIGDFFNRHASGEYENVYLQAAWLGFNAPRRNVKESVN